MIYQRYKFYMKAYRYNSKKREDELIQLLITSEFQLLSDYDLQNDLISELRSIGYDGYTTNNEIALF